MTAQIVIRLLLYFYQLVTSAVRISSWSWLRVRWMVHCWRWWHILTPAGKVAYSVRTWNICGQWRFFKEIMMRHISLHKLLFQIFRMGLHCNKSLCRIPPAWPEGARPNGQGRGSFCPLHKLVFYFPPCLKIFMAFSGYLPSEKQKECDQGGMELTSLGVLILYCNPRPHLPCMRAENIKC